MIHTRRTLLLLAAILAALLVVTATTAQDGEVVTVAGMLQGTNEDDEGNPQSVYLQDDNLGPILVADDAKGRELLELVGSRVKVTGRLEESDGLVQGFSMVIHVSSYARLDEE